MRIYRVGSKLYMWCNRCDALVRINKPVIGGIHFCLPSRKAK